MQGTPYRQPRVHRFTGLTSGEVYNRTQCDESIRDGDVLVVPPNASEEHGGIVGVMVEAWPVVVHGGNPDGTDHKLHLLDDRADFLARSPEYRVSFELALDVSPRELSRQERDVLATRALGIAPGETIRLELTPELEAELAPEVEGVEVVVFGPNLSSVAQRKGYMHVHRAGCGDCSGYGPGRRFGGEDNGWTIRARSRREVVEAIYPPGDFGYDADADWTDYDDLYVAPCVTWTEA